MSFHKLILPNPTASKDKSLEIIFAVVGATNKGFALLTISHNFFFFKNEFQSMLPKY